MRKGIRSFLSALLLLVSALTVSAQNDFVTSFMSKDDEVGRRARLDGLYFFVNDEYFAPQAEGYTLFGLKLRPTLEYDIVDKLSLVGGFEMLQYGGLERVHKVSPFFAAKWQMDSTWVLRMGALPGPASHCLPDEVQNVENQLTERPEFGARLTASAQWCDFEAWLNWRQFIFRGDSIPEKFTAGLRASGRHKKGKALFVWRANLTFDHIGGQISDYAEPVQSLATAEVCPSIGLLKQEPSLRYFALRFGVLGHKAMAGRNVRPFASGWAVHPSARVDVGLLKMQVGYFRSCNFYAPHGNPLYWSVSNYDGAYYEKRRSIVDFSAYLNKYIDYGVCFSIGGRGFYDTSASRFDYMYGFHIAISVVH